MIDLEEVLSHYDVKGKVEGTSTGPLISQIRFKPAPGTKIKNITSSLADISREMGLKNLRVSNVCEGGCIGFEIPNDELKTTPLLDILETPEFQNAKGALPISMGVNIKGEPVFSNLAKMPHLLVAGATGSGKSVGLNAFIISLMKRLKPADLKFVMIDPKRIEFSVYNDQKYMFMPVITENSKATSALKYLVSEMNNRYKLFEESLTKNIEEYNENVGHMPYIVVIVDEFSDLVLMEADVEKQIQILAQKARASGIHLILATQRPSVDVVTGSIKANFPSRLAFKTASGVDSKTILDMTGAEDLIGRGDAFFLAANGELSRVHGAYISTSEIDEFFKPYRAQVKEPDLSEFENKPEEKKSQTVVNKQSAEPKFFLTVWFKKIWNWFSKSEKKRIIKAVIAFFVAAFFAKNSDKKSSKTKDKILDKVLDKVVKR